MPPKRNVKKPVKIVEPEPEDDYEYESIISKLKFEASSAKHDDGRVQIEARLIGDFVDSDLKKDLNILANDLQGSKLKGSKDNNISIGITCHYKGINKWTPALMRNINGEMQLWDASYDEKTADLYANDKIDAIVVYIIGGPTTITHLRGNGKKSNVDKRLFK